MRKFKKKQDSYYTWLAAVCKELVRISHEYSKVKGMNTINFMTLIEVLKKSHTGLSPINALCVITNQKSNTPTMAPWVPTTAAWPVPAPVARGPPRTAQSLLLAL